MASYVKAEWGDKTDHKEEIYALRALALAVEQGGVYLEFNDQVLPAPLVSAVTRCAAGLLEVHDDTGISLDNWRGPRELVELALTLTGLDPDDHFLENKV